MKYLFSLLSLVLVIVLFSCKTGAPPPVDVPSSPLENLKINQIQIIASHNSYRIHTYEPLFQAILGLGTLIPPSFNPLELDYTHEPLTTQLNQYGMRGLELDVYHDPLGGHFYYRGGNVLINQPRISHIPELLEPGFKILHIPDIDYMTHHYTFLDALKTIKKWSDSHPNHLPLFINVEPKEDALRDQLENDSLVFALKFSPNAADSLDNEIRAVFGQDLANVMTPDKIRGNFANLYEVVKAGKLPTIAEARGKIFFILDTSKDFYKTGHPALQGRVMFQYVAPRSPECLFAIGNSPLTQKDSIKQWVKEGFMVRSRADEGTHQAREGDYSMMNAAFESGAQIISTDYYRQDPRNLILGDTTWTDFEVHFPNKELARVNPISANPSMFVKWIFGE